MEMDEVEEEMKREHWAVCLACCYGDLGSCRFLQIACFKNVGGVSIQ